MVNPPPVHRFTPGFQTAGITADWCGHGALDAARTGDASLFCGQLASDPVHAVDPPDDVLTRALDQVWCAAVDAAGSPDFTDDADRELYRASVFAQARSVAVAPRDPEQESAAAGRLIEGWTRSFTTELIRDPLVSCTPGNELAIQLLAERLAAAAYGIAMGRPHPLAPLLEQIRRADWYPSPVVDQSTWPAHLRDDAPRQPCGRCGRFTWSTSQFGQKCRMTQPDGQRCDGRFGPAAS